MAIPVPERMGNEEGSARISRGVFYLRWASAMEEPTTTAAKQFSDELIWRCLILVDGFKMRLVVASQPGRSSIYGMTIGSCY
ncbi:hypothetical protein EJB05_05249, partial [Eragrostis curvula]